MPAWYLASAEKPPKLASVLAPVGNLATLCLVLSPGATALLASGALQTLPWFGGEAAELRRQQA